MKEDFLAYVWQHQYFDRSALRTQSGDLITVLRPGRSNSDSGPDFLEARIEIGGILWIGSVELHVRTSDWNGHGHSNDNAYQNVILHVVWENDLSPESYPNTRLPVVALKSQVPAGILTRYLSILEALNDIPCEHQFAKVRMLEKHNMLEKTLVERLERKSHTVSNLLEQNNGDWEETAWQLLARYFGARINADSFQNLAERIPFKILLRHRDNLFQLEALLFGTAGLIPGGSTSPGYVSNLRMEYDFLCRKHHLKQKKLRAIEWKLLRLRPAGFPTVRIAQLASLIQRKGNIFSMLTTFHDLQGLTDSLKSVQSAYWHTHYHFSKPAETLVPAMGTDAIHLLIINAAVPLLATYAYKTGNRDYLDKAIRVLEDLPAEKNKITRKWKSLGLKLVSAAASQGATEWYNNYCVAKRCLHCAVGNSILGKNTRNY